MTFAEMEKPEGGIGCFCFVLFSFPVKREAREDEFCFVYFKFDMPIRNTIEILSRHTSEVW